MRSAHSFACILVAAVPWVCLVAPCGEPAREAAIRDVDGELVRVRKVTTEEWKRWAAMPERDRQPLPAGKFVIQVQRAGTDKFEDLGEMGVIHPGDALRLDDQTMAQVRFRDGVSMMCGNSTHLTVSRREGVAAGRMITELTLHQGYIRLLTGRPPDRSLVVRTTAAEIRNEDASRSEFAVEHRPPGAAPRPGEPARGALCPLCSQPLAEAVALVGLTELVLWTGRVCGKGTVENKLLHLEEQGQRSFFGDLYYCRQCRDRGVDVVAEFPASPLVQLAPPPIPAPPLPPFAPPTPAEKGCGKTEEKKVTQGPLNLPWLLQPETSAATARRQTPPPEPPPDIPLDH